MTVKQEKQEVIDIKQIMEVIPHRYPFLLVDKILEMDLEAGTILGLKNVTINESFFQGHFPGAPIMPGVLILEALAQAGGFLCYRIGGKGKIAVLSNIKNAKFRHPVRPGDSIHLKGEGIHLGTKGGKIKCTALVNGKCAVEAEMGFVLVPKENV